MAVYRLSDTYSTTPAGLVYITSSTFSAASTVSVNGCFTATYENYRIVLYLSVATGTVLMQMRMRASASDDSSANYANQNLDVGGTTSTATRTTAATSMSVAYTSTSGGWGAIDVFRPQLAAPTYMVSLSGVAVGNPGVELFSGGHNVSTAYDGFTIYPASSTITGSLAVYGYRKA